MSGPEDWLQARRPEPPEGLMQRLGSATGLTGRPLVEHLAREAVAALDRARGDTGRVRESALDLLVADALITYACEAALDLPDADAVLHHLAQTAAQAR